MIQVTCACGATMQVDDANAGKQCKCPTCGAVCQIPGAGAPAPAAARAAAPAAAPAAAAATPPAKRPGGLTALAVLNFVFGGFGIIGGLITLLAGGVVSSSGDFSKEFARGMRRAAAESNDPNAAEIANKLAGGDASSLGMMFYILGILGLILAAFLIVAGVGYLKQSKGKGWMFGNIYGVSAVIVVFLQIAMLGAGFGFGVILGLAYPIITLALLNTSFKNSFPNP